jgi:hypothetical protein
VTLAAIACGGAAVNGASRGSVRFRSPALAGAAAVVVVAFVGLVGNLQVARARAALADGNWRSASSHARTAHRWAPWSSEPYRLLGEAELADGRILDARAAFRDAIDRSASAWELWFDLGRTTTGAPQRRALARASALNPKSPEIAELRSEIRQGWTPSDEVRS